MKNIRKFINKYILSYFGLTLMSNEDINVLVKHEIHHYEYNRLVRDNLAFHNKNDVMYNITKDT